MTEKSEKILKEIELLLAIQCKLLLNTAITGEIKNSPIFQLTGKKSRDEIVKKLNISSKTISPLWQKWEECGILYKEGKTYKKVSEKIDYILKNK